MKLYELVINIYIYIYNFIYILVINGNELISYKLLINRLGFKNCDIMLIWVL